MEISIVSYNILADCYVRVPNQPWNGFDNCSDQDLDWASRLPRIIESLLRSRADVICLQEVVFENRDGVWGLPQWVDALECHGYRGVMQCTSQKDISKNSARNLKMVGKSTPTGVATFYNYSTLSEVSPAQHGSGSGLTLFLGPNKSTGPVLCVNNIHLVGDPSKVDVHVNQLAGVLKHFSGTGFEQCVQIVCGDFNSDITLSLPGKVVPTWFETNQFCRVPTGVSWAYGGVKSRLDHIMYRTRLNTVISGVFPAEDTTILYDNLPNSIQPSDHVMVGAVLCVSK